MDPDVTLAAMLADAGDVIDRLDDFGYAPMDPVVAALAADARRLAEGVKALDAWLHNGHGFMPKRWANGHE